MHDLHTREAQVPIPVLHVPPSVPWDGSLGPQLQQDPRVLTLGHPAQLGQVLLE